MLKPSSRIKSFNWATKPAAADYSGRLIRISDVGVHGSIWFSDGTRWIHESPIILQQAAKGWIVPSLAEANAATYSQTGTTLTVTSVGHNIPATVHDGKDVYLAIASGGAVAGWYSNFTRTGGDTFTCESSVSQSTSGTVNTNTAATIVTPVTKTMLGGLMGSNGLLQAVFHFTCPASASARQLRWLLNAVNVLLLSAASTTVDSEIAKIIKNQGDSAKQEFRNASLGAFLGNSAAACQYATINTDADFESQVSLQVAAASEFICLESFSLLVNPS